MVKRLKIIFVVLGLLTLTVGLSQESSSIYETDFKKEKLKRKVKQVKQTCHRAELKDGKIVIGQPTGDEMDNFTLLFNAKGKLVEHTGYWPGGIQKVKISLKYDSTQKLTEENYLSGNHNEKKTWEYADGLLIKEENHVEKATKKFIYNENKHLTETFWRNSSGRFVHDSIKCDSNGRKISSKIYLSKNELFEITTYAYDKYGNQTLIKTFNKNKIILRSQVMLYDDKHHLLESVEYNPDGSILRKYVYTYDANGNLLDWTWTDTNGKEVLSYKHTYDSHGNRTQWIMIKDGKYKDREENYIYEYDNIGNWTRQTIIKDKIPVKINLRQIGYYK